MSTSNEQTVSFNSKEQRPINLLFVIGSLPFGGAENQVVTMASALHGDHYRVYVCCLRQDSVLANSLRANGIEVISLNMRQRYLPVALYRLYRLIKRLKPLILHTHLSEADIWGRLMGKLAGVPVITSTLHGMSYWQEHHHLRRPLNYLANHFTDEIIAVSEQIRQTFIQKQGWPSEKIITIPNTVYIEQFCEENSRAHLRAQLGFSDSTPVIGTVARLVPVKRLDHVLEAARVVCNEIPQARFLIIGDGPLRANLEHQAQQLKLLPTSILFLGNRTDVPALLSAMDIFVLSSESEGLPVSLLEAMAATKPVVATRVGGIPQLIEDRKNGLLISVHDPAGLANAILMLLKDENMSNVLAVEAHQTVRTRYSTMVIRNQISDLYDRLLNKKGMKSAPRFGL